MEAMAKNRNYKEEYRRRIANAAKRGFTRSQARGHARPGEASLKPIRLLDQSPLEAALKAMRQRGSLTKAAKAHRISPERLRRYISDKGLAERRGQTWTFTDTRLRKMQIFSQGEARQIVIAGFEEASLNGAYLNAVKAFSRTNDIDLLKPFVGKSVTDAGGKIHPFETNPNALHRIMHSGSEAFHDIYRLVS
jgi:hypothetical protein